ncbi:MAG: prolyl oligopeptidase family serine peptidase [Myxococcota bacterium]
MRFAFLLAVLVGCGDDSGVVTDAGPGTDAAVNVDSAVATDSGTPPDSGGTDSALPDVGVDVPPGCTPAFAAGTNTQSIAFGGSDREYVLHVPATLSAGAALVIDLHGFTESPNRQDGRSGMRAKADAEGFLLVQPRGEGNSWNAGACCGRANDNDVEFMRAIVNEVADAGCVDRSRVYATGMSNGGFLAHRIACEGSDFVAAIAPVAGVLGIDESACSPGRPVPVMHFHGTSDLIVPFNGNVFLSYPSVEDTIAFWRTTNGCGGDSSSMSVGSTECETWASCSAASEVVLCTTSGFGHDWPDGGGNINATDAMWDFFQRHRLP